MPRHLQLLVKWEVVSPNSRYREFYHEIGNIEKCPFTYWLNGRWFLQIVDIHVGNFNMKLTGRWFPQIVDMDSGNLYPIYIYIYITKIVVLVFEPVRGRSRATELPCCTYVSSVMRSSWHFNISGFNVRFPRTPQNENKNLKKCSSDYFHILHIVELWCDFKMFVGAWSIYI